MEKKRKTVTAVLFALVIIILPIIFMFSHKSDFSADENRMLAKKPKLSTETIADKSFMKDLEKYLSDHFPERIEWVEGKMAIDRFSGKDII